MLKRQFSILSLLILLFLLFSCDEKNNVQYEKEPSNNLTFSEQSLCDSILAFVIGEYAFLTEDVENVYKNVLYLSSENADRYYEIGFRNKSLDSITVIISYTNNIAGQGSKVRYRCPCSNQGICAISFGVLNGGVVECLQSSCSGTCDLDETIIGSLINPYLDFGFDLMDEIPIVPINIIYY